MQKQAATARMGRERGATLVFLGLSLAVLLGIMALAVDLGMLYVGRSEAQRAADAAALAGAYQFSISSCTSPGGDCSSDTTTQNAARARAEGVGDANSVLLQAVSIADADVTMSYPQPTEPQVTVTVRRTNVPTIFARIFGKSLASVSAVATAEAYQAGANGCVVPFLLANCQLADNLLGTNSACPAGGYYFIDSNTNLVDNNLIGQSLALHTADNTGSSVPSQWYLAGIGGTGSPSKSVLRQNIEDCSVGAIVCGNNSIDIPSIPGSSVGPVGQGVDVLIGATGDGPGNNQDYLVQANPLEIAANGPSGTVSTGPSSSMVTIPVYNNVNNAASPGTTSLSEGFTNTVQVVGFAQVFINYVAPPGIKASLPAPCDKLAGPFNNSPVCVTILKLTLCNGISPVNSSWSPVPVRLIQRPDSQ